MLEIGSVSHVFKEETIAQEVKEWSEEVGKTAKVAGVYFQGISNFHAKTDTVVVHSRVKYGNGGAVEDFETALNELLERFKGTMKKDETYNFTFKTKLYSEHDECLGKRVWKAKAEVETQIAAEEATSSLA